MSIDLRSVTRPKMMFCSDPGVFLHVNHKELCSLIHYICDKKGCLKYEEDYRQWFFLKYLSGRNNYKKDKGDLSTFMFHSVYFKLDQFLELQEVSDRQVPMGLGLDLGITDYDIVGVRSEFRFISKFLYQSGGIELVRVFKLMMVGYDRRDVQKELKLSPQKLYKILKLLRVFYRSLYRGYYESHSFAVS
jgi:hypothetical protein